MNNVKRYTLKPDEPWKDFLARAMTDIADKRWLKMGGVLLDILSTELSGKVCYVYADATPDSITITLTHDRSAVDNVMIKVIRDFVDELHYVHNSRTSHLLTIHKTFDIPI